MTAEKVRQVLATYRELFSDLKVGKADYPHDEPVDACTHALEHCHGMLDKMEVFITEGRMDKVYRWLGFIQGVLWSQGIYILDDLRNQNRKDPETPA